MQYRRISKIQCDAIRATAAHKTFATFDYFMMTSLSLRGRKSSSSIDGSFEMDLKTNKAISHRPK